MKYFGIYYWQLRVTRLVPSADDKSRVTISAYSYVYACRMEMLEIGEKKKDQLTLCHHQFRRKDTEMLS